MKTRRSRPRSISIAVYARFDAICVKLTYMSQGAEHDAVEVTIESAEPTVAAPTKSGYEFIGWFEDEACEIPFDYQEFFANYFTAGASDVTVYAGFARIATITYLADATPESQEQTVTSSTSVSAAQIPKKPGYDFVGWYREGEQEAFDFAAYFEFDAERQDVTLHARFEVRTVYIWYYADPSSDKLFYTQPVTIDIKQEHNGVPSKQGYKFKAWYTDPECTEEFDFDAYFADPDKQSVSVYAGYESTAVTTTITYDFDGDGLCDDCAAPVIVYTDNSGLELYDYRIGYISGNATNNSVNLKQAIPGASDFNLVGADGYVTLKDDNTLNAVGATPSNTPVLLQYIADSLNGDKIAKTVKVHVLDGYTNVSGDWSDLYDAIMQSGDVRNVVVQSAMTAPANAQKSNGFVFIDYDYDISLDNRKYPEAGPSPYTLNLYGNALKWDVSSMIMNGIDIFRIEWIAKTINITDVHMFGGTNVASATGAYFVANGSTVPTTPVFNVTHCLTDNGLQHYRVGSSSVNIKNSIHINSHDAVIKAGSNSGPGNNIVIENSVLANSDTSAILIWGVSSNIQFKGFADVYNWKDRDDPKVVIDEDLIKNSEIKKELQNSKFDQYFVGSGGKDYTNLVVLRIDIDANITDNAEMGFVTAEYTKKILGIPLGTAYLTLINKGDPLATMYDNPSLNYELNFGRR